MSQPRYPRRNELPESVNRSPRRRLVGLSLLAAVALAPKCGAMPYTAYDPDLYRAPDVANRADTTSDLNARTAEDLVEHSSQDLVMPDMVETLDDAVEAVDDLVGSDSVSGDAATDSTQETSR